MQLETVLVVLVLIKESIFQFKVEVRVAMPTVTAAVEAEVVS